ncbi:mycothiol synthase [Asanoa iriomotensis]|uniref:Mycothiol acetyltransferase n=1 Tax=Asanoa iriomotensis TaxID=234613 RepID=A0ABQ4C244_9ACTN|nr:mycothiol synthase [Asanoa iriomotensis]GIF56856.1 mycothiol acetyltransferase [Asanoa iriomotensis]
MTNVIRLAHLSDDDVAAVLDLAAQAGDTDGTYPFSEHVVLHIRRGGEQAAVHLLVREPDGTLAGYAHVDTTDAVEGAAAELVVHPAHRRHGLGRALVDAAISATEEAGLRSLRLWAHGDHPSAGALGVELGFTRARVLFQMRRSLFAPLPERELPPGVTLRAFEPGRDEQEWVRVNARAFAHHPDQGRWTIDDLRIRMAEPWFDPAGFLLAVDADTGAMLGFHWTKVHGEGGHQHDPIGEVYVVGVDPDAHGRGLGAALTVAGLRHLRGAGLDQAMLYVDESNTPAVRLYTGLGFAVWSTDVSYRRSWE